MDALFWTESAIEKFLFPYYEQLRIFDLDYLDRLKAAFYDPKSGHRIVAIAHVPPSHSDPVHDPRAAERMRILVDRQEEGTQDLMSLDDFLTYVAKLKPPMP